MGLEMTKVLHSASADVREGSTSEIPVYQWLGFDVVM